MWNNFAVCKETAERDALAEHLIHKKKLQRIRPRVNNKAPKDMPHVKLKKKKKVQDEKIFNDIQHCNEILLGKLEKVKTFIDKDLKKFGKQPWIVSRARFEEGLKIDGENNRMMSRIRSATSQYSAWKMEKEYKYCKYLGEKLSENARRIPRISSYNTLETNNNIKSQRTSRPVTSAGDGGTNRMSRPVSAKLIKQEL